MLIITSGFHSISSPFKPIKSHLKLQEFWELPPLTRTRRTSDSPTFCVQVAKTLLTLVVLANNVKNIYFNPCRCLFANWELEQQDEEHRKKAPREAYIVRAAWILSRSSRVKKQWYCTNQGSKIRKMLLQPNIEGWKEITVLACMIGSKIIVDHWKLLATLTV